jgi:hypothetical protein
MICSARDSVSRAGRLAAENALASKPVGGLTDPETGCEAGLETAWAWGSDRASTSPSGAGAILANEEAQRLCEALQPNILHLDLSMLGPEAADAVRFPVQTHLRRGW